MNPLISFVYTMAALVITAVLLTIRKSCRNLNRFRDVVGLFAGFILTLGGFLLINYSARAYVIVGAVFCAAIVMYALYLKLERTMATSAILIMVGGSFAMWPSFISYNLYYLLNGKAVDEALKLREISEDKPESKDESDKKDV